MNMMHPKNQVSCHEIVIDAEKEASKDFTGLNNPQLLCKLLNKSMKLGKHFQIPELTPEQIKAKPDSAYRFMNTTRNGFVSALAISHNYHVPLILSPNDIWLVVMQGFRFHLDHHADKSYILNTFKDINKVPENVKEGMTITGDDLDEDITKIPDDVFEQALYAAIHGTLDKMWNDKNQSEDFAPTDDFKGTLIPVQKLTDMFTFSMTSELQFAETQDRIKQANHEKAVTEAEKNNMPEPDAPQLLSEATKAQLTAKAQKINSFYNCLFGMATVNSQHMVLHD